ncbi:MAG: glycine cleavage system protein GcvH [Spirochaetales bacterium]|nr:glycine cleavage system protein GcvH [Spirochaetales bacterium]
MADVYYTQDHTWIRGEGSSFRVGLSEFAQQELGEIAFVELPEAGREVEQGEAVCSIDSLKSTSEIYAPISGTIVAVNQMLETEEHCGLVNSDPLGQGWLFAIQPKDPAELASLLSPAEYERYLAEG